VCFCIHIRTNFPDPSHSELLALAVISKSEATVKYLLEKGYKPRPSGFDLHVACYIGSLRLTQLLLHHLDTPKGKAYLQVCCYKIPFLTSYFLI